MITEFQGEYRWLSNFWTGCRVTGPGGLIYDCVETAYVAGKVGIPDLYEEIRDMKPATAKYFGKGKETPAFMQNRIPFMRVLIRSKFDRAANPELHSKLLATGIRPLIEGNRHGDIFWGICGGKGKNNLGQIIMQVREEYKS